MAEDEFIELRKIKEDRRKQKFKEFLSKAKEKTEELGRRAKIKIQQHRKDAVTRTALRAEAKERMEQQRLKRLDKEITLEKKRSKLRGLQRKHRPKAARGPSAKQTARRIGGPSQFGTFGLFAHEPRQKAFGEASTNKVLPDFGMGSSKPMKILPDFNLGFASSPRRKKSKKKRRK